MKTLEEDDDDMAQWPSIRPSPQFEQFLVFSQLKDFKSFVPSIYSDGPWW
jgi:hypothetical protein